MKTNALENSMKSVQLSRGRGNIIRQSKGKTVYCLLIHTNQSKTWENTGNVQHLVMIQVRSVCLQK